MTKLPLDIPLNVTILNVGHNRLQYVANTTFVGLTNLRQINLNGNYSSEDCDEKTIMISPKRS